METACSSCSNVCDLCTMTSLCVSVRSRAALSCSQVHHSHVLAPVLPHAAGGGDVPPGRGRLPHRVIGRLAVQQLDVRISGLQRRQDDARGQNQANIQTCKHAHDQRSDVPLVLDSGWVHCCESVVAVTRQSSCDDDVVASDDYVLFLRLRWSSCRHYGYYISSKTTRVTHKYTCQFSISFIFTLVVVLPTKISCVPQATRTLTRWIFRPGLLWTECKQLYNTGLRVYLLDNYNGLDFLVLSLYLASYALRFLVDFRVKQADRHYNGTARAEEALLNGNLELFAEIRDEIFHDTKDPLKRYFMQACESAHFWCWNLLGAHRRCPDIQSYAWFTHMLTRIRGLDLRASKSILSVDKLLMHDVDNEGVSILWRLFSFQRASSGSKMTRRSSVTYCLLLPMW